MESTTDTRVLDAPQRPRWKKALSLGSATSTERFTDLDELDMEALAADGALTRNPRTGVYSGWVHVATAGTGRVAFEKRFCRLEELVCKFYAEERDFEQRIRPVNRHVIISVRRVHSRNKTFVFTDYEDRTVMLHTTMGADFELWYGTFAAVVKETQVAKTRGVGRNPRRATTTTPRSTGAYRRQASADDAQRLRALTAPTFFASTSWLRPDRPQDELPPIVVDEDDPERTHTAWFYMEAPWWRKLLLRRRHLRRYFVFSGATVSCFSVNKEGKRALFTYTITACSEPAPTLLELDCGSLHTLRLHSNSSAAATATYIRRALH